MRFERCAYLQFNEQLVCFGLSEIGASAITGLFEKTVYILPNSFSVGATAKLTNHHLIVGGYNKYDLSCAKPFVSLLQNQFSNEVPLIVKRALITELTGPAAGFAPLLRQIDVGKRERDSTVFLKKSNSESDLVNFVLPSMVALSHQLRAQCRCFANNDHRVEFDSPKFEKLLGAGPGLTPSGDDFFCGVLCTLHLFGFSVVANSLWNSVANTARRSTTQVSVALIEQSALGEIGERLEHVLLAYYQSSITAGEFEHLLTQIGETSGWDWFTGFVFCSDILLSVTNQ